MTRTDRHEVGVRMVEVGTHAFEVHECGGGHDLALCLHGFPEHAHAWRFQLPLLARRGYRAWAPNLRGYGRSWRPARMRDYAIENLLEDVAGLIDAAAPRRTLLLAHDWGAVIAWYFAMRRLRPLDGLVIMNVPHPVPMRRELARNRTQRRRSWYVAFFQLPVLPERLLGRSGAAPIARLFREGPTNPGNFAPEDVAVFVDNARRPGALKAMIDYYRALVRGGGARRQARLGYPAIRTPTLMLWGEADMALTRETTLGTERHVERLTLRYLPGISHWVQQDAPERVNAMLEAWLTGAPVPHADGAEGDLDP